MTEPEQTTPAGAPPRRLNLPDALRVLRRRADLSQRELADRSGVPLSTVGTIESGGSANPGIRTVERLVAATGARLAIVDTDGSEPVRLPTDDWYDGADRRFPAHLDPRRITWRGIGPVAGFAFLRNRQRRDTVRRWSAGHRRGDITCEVRRLGPGDTALLAALRVDDPDLVPGGPDGSPATPLSDQEALRYLRDPSVRHWVAEEPGLTDARLRGRLLGQLVAHLHHRHTGPPAIVVTDLRFGPEHPGTQVGDLLVAAMCDEAARLEAGEIVAMPADRSAARRLRALGFRRSRRSPLLAVD